MSSFFSGTVKKFFGATMARPPPTPWKNGWYAYVSQLEFSHRLQQDPIRCFLGMVSVFSEEFITSPKADQTFLKFPVGTDMGKITPPPKKKNWKLPKLCLLLCGKILSKPKNVGFGCQAPNTVTFS